MITKYLATKKFLFVIIAAMIVFLGNSATAASIVNNPDAVVGVWKTGDGNAIVRIYKNGETYQGKIVWLKEPNDPDTGKPKLDKNNPTETSKNRPVVGLVNIWGFKFIEKNLWDEGNIYDPKSGNTYSCTIKMLNANTLEVRGYIGVSLIGRTDVWTKQVVKN
ncbi:hypothetical protein PBAC_28070 [Pedobacter glucosidilyticus]|nr:DUF2147 domain-containing protein [Pedobacter glucosidilyticus]KHJ37030.1 hypothetical protein PBAC_28070 [Pedobacter glucosidilyticus]